MYGKKGEDNPNYGIIRSEEQKNKIRENNPRRKEVYCVELDRTFKSYRQAAKILLNEYGIKCSHASISNVCNGRDKYAGYYIDSNLPAYLHFETIITNND
jgi:hypothetical protein